MYPFDPDVLFEDLTHPMEHPAEHRGQTWFKGVRDAGPDLHAPELARPTRTPAVAAELFGVPLQRHPAEPYAG